MKTIIIKVPNNKAAFWTKLIRELGIEPIISDKADEERHDNLLKEIEEGFRDVKKMRAGSKKKKSLNDLLNAK